MSCLELEKLIALLLEGDLPDRKHGVVREHLRICRHCQQFSRSLSASQAMVKSLGEQVVDEAVFQEVRTRVLSVLPAEKERSGFPVWRYALVAGALLMALVLASITLRHASKVHVGVVTPPARELTKTEPPERPHMLPRRSPVRVARGRRSSRPAKHVQADMVPPSRRARSEPLKVKFVTDDPKVVIYWLID
jgi:hypothetical protein